MVPTRKIWCSGFNALISDQRLLDQLDIVLVHLSMEFREQAVHLVKEYDGRARYPWLFGRSPTTA